MSALVGYAGGRAPAPGKVCYYGGDQGTGALRAAGAARGVPQGYLLLLAGVACCAHGLRCTALLAICPPAACTPPDCTRYPSPATHPAVYEELGHAEVVQVGGWADGGGNRGTGSPACAGLVVAAAGRPASRALPSSCPPRCPPPALPADWCRWTCAATRRPPASSTAPLPRRTSARCVLPCVLLSSYQTDRPAVHAVHEWVHERAWVGRPAAQQPITGSSLFDPSSPTALDPPPHPPLPPASSARRPLACCALTLRMQGPVSAWQGRRARG